MPLFSAANRTWESHLEGNRGLIFTNIICGMRPKMNVLFFFPSLIPVQLLCLFSTRPILWPEEGVERVGLFRLMLGWTWYRISWGLYLQAA